MNPFPLIIGLSIVTDTSTTTCVAANLQITKIKTITTKGHYVIISKALFVAYGMDQLIQGAFGASDKVTIESVVKTSFYTPPVPMAPTTSTTRQPTERSLEMYKADGPDSRGEESERSRLSKA